MPEEKENGKGGGWNRTGFLKERKAGPDYPSYFPFLEICSGAEERGKKKGKGRDERRFSLLSL